MVLPRLVRRNYGRKLPVSIKYQNLHSFKEGMIHLHQSILEMRQISHLHGSVQSKLKSLAQVNFFGTFALQFLTFCDNFSLVQRAFCKESIKFLVFSF